MTTPKTVRIYAEDYERAKVLALFWLGKAPADVLHAALDEFYERHRPEMDARLARVQEAVLSNDRQKLRDLFIEDARAAAAASTVSIQKLIDSKESISVEDDPDQDAADQATL